MNKEQIYQYGKTAAPAVVVGAALGFGGAVATDTPVKQTQTYQNLQTDYDDLQADNQDLQDQISQLPTQERVDNLVNAVEMREETINQLREENEDLEEAVTQANERTGLVDYLPVFSDEDVEFSGNIAVTVDQDVAGGEGDYDQLDVNYVSDDGEYDVTVTEYEESEDAEDVVEDFREAQTPVEFTADGDTHTVEVSGFTGQLDAVEFDYDDEDAVEDVDEDDIESVTVDGEDITDHVEGVSYPNGDKQLRVALENYYVNEGETVTVTFSDAGEGDLQSVQVSDNGDWTDYEYDQDDDTREDVYRDGNTVVEVEGTDNGDNFEAQYADLTGHYE